MDLQRMSEAGQVARVRQIFAEMLAKGARDLVDDAAELPAPPPGSQRVICADQVIEGRHFLLGADAHQAAADAGWRAIVRNVSDLAAMGAQSVGFVWTLALPERWVQAATEEQTLLYAFLCGAAEAAASYDCALYGGDLASVGDHPMVASVTAFGDVSGRPLTRDGARPGDGIFVSRPLGASAAGLSLLLEGRPRGEIPTPWRMAHLRPLPEASLGPRLVGVASACMDISDGLLMDLGRMCRASRVAAELDATDAVIDPSIRADPAAKTWALSGGEDYALLFTGPENLQSHGIRVGTVRAGEGMFLVENGSRRPIAAKGWDHFGSSSDL